MSFFANSQYLFNDEVSYFYNRRHERTVPRLFCAPGQIIVKNTIENFKSCDKKELQIGVAKKVCFDLFLFTNYCLLYSFIDVFIRRITIIFCISNHSTNMHCTYTATPLYVVCVIMVCSSYTMYIASPTLQVCDVFLSHLIFY